MASPRCHVIREYGVRRASLLRVLAGVLHFSSEVRWAKGWKHIFGARLSCQTLGTMPVRSLSLREAAQGYQLMQESRFAL